MSADDMAAAEGAAMFHDLPVDIRVVIGTATPLVGEVLSLTRDSVIPLTSRIDDPVLVYVGDRLIARGELEAQEDGTGLSVRITEIPGKGGS